MENSTTVSEKMLKSHQTAQAEMLMLHDLRDLMEKHLYIHGMTPEDEEAIEGARVDVTVGVSIGPELASLLKMHMQTILTLLPDGVAVVSTEILDKMRDMVPTGYSHVGEIAVSHGAALVQQQALDARRASKEPTQ